MGFVFLAFLFACNNASSSAKPFTSLHELHAAIETAANTGASDVFWDRILAHKELPIIFSEKAFLFWRGSAKTVEWRGDFSSWEATPDTQGKRLGITDIWYYERSLPRDARLDYKIVVDGDQWTLDPLNPNKQIGGFGPNSELRMPDWKVPATGIRRDGIARGHLSKDIPFKSAKLGYTVNYRVYTPANFDSASMKDLPVIYVTDGSDYYTDEMGSLVITLDNLIADQSINPILVVFIDPWDRKNNVNRREGEFIPASDRSCSFCEFIVGELIPTIETAYPASKSREGRAILGTSYGGLHATFMFTQYGSLFGMVGIQSPAFHRAPWILSEIDNASPLPSKAFINIGTFEGEAAVRNARSLSESLRNKVLVKYMELHEGHSWGQWRAVLDDMLIFFYGKAN